MTRLITCFFACLLLTACATGTQDEPRASTAETAGAQGEADDGSEIRCVYTAGTRSRLQSRDCRTVAEWERIRNAGQAQREQVRDGQSGGGS